MEAFVLRRGRLAAAAAVAAAALAAGLLVASPPPVVAGPTGLQPDLVTLTIQQEELLMERDGDRTVLRFSNEIGNRGGGPLEMFPSEQGSDCDGDGNPDNDRDASQRVFADSDGSGAFERDTDGVASERVFGCMRYHGAHDHWHVLQTSTYELRSEPSGKLVTRIRKVGFCHSDYRLAFPSPSTPSTGTYPINPPGMTGCQSFSTQGMSPGWADAYLLTLPGQDLDVTDLPRGHYCLTSRADPDGLLTELDEDNNVRRVRLAMRPAKLIVRKLETACRL